MSSTEEMAANFRERAKACIPRWQSVTPTQYWVGILNHNVKPEDDFTDENFVWIKGHGVRQKLIYFKTRH